jgi:hypothetical protein
MDNTVDLEMAKSMLLRFFDFMHAWELGCAAREAAAEAGQLNFDEAKRISMEQFEVIFRQVCSQSIAQRRTYHFSIPPKYDPHEERIAEAKMVDCNTIEIRTYQARTEHFGSYLYRLVREEGAWKLSKAFYVALNGELEGGSL